MSPLRSGSDNLRILGAFSTQIGAEALERVALALGARAALPVCRRLLKEGIGGWAWQQQHAALTAIGVLANGTVLRDRSMLLDLLHKRVMVSIISGVHFFHVVTFPLFWNTVGSLPLLPFCVSVQILY